MSGVEFLLDTNVIIGFLGGRDAARDLIVRYDATPEKCAVSQITRMELLSFTKLTDSEALSVHSFLGGVRVILLDERIEDAAIALRLDAGLKLPDAIIGATARVHGLKLLTLNERLEAVMSGQVS